MRTLIGTILVVLSVQAVNAQVICEKRNGRWYPKNELALKIAESLGVKTCSGGRFKEVVKKLGEKSNVTASKKSMSVEDVVNSLKKN